MKKSILAFLALQSISLFAFEFTFDPIDVVFVCHPKDQRTINLAVDGARRFVKNCRRVIVVSEYKLTDNAEWFDEAKFPFTKQTLADNIFKDKEDAVEFVTAPNSRMGWIYQQYLKFYSIFVIPDISSNVLIVDADTVFLKPISFQDPQTGAGLYNPTHYVYRPYFEHNERVLPGWKQMFPGKSGICHHILVQRSVMDQLFKDIKDANGGKEPWLVFSEAVDHQYVDHCCMCVDYELYFNYVFSKTDAVKFRPLRFLDIAFREFNGLRNKGYDYLSCHTYKKTRFFGNSLYNFVDLDADLSEII